MIPRRDGFGFDFDFSGCTIPRRDGFGFGFVCFSWMDYSQSVSVLFWTNFLYSVVAEDEWA